MVRTFQSRMGHFHDKLRRRLADNTISLTGQAADCIRIQNKRTRVGDIETRVVEAADVVSVIFPILKDVPYRRIHKSPSGIRIDTLPTAMELFPMQVMIPNNNKIYIGDLLFRVLRDPDDDTYYNDYTLRHTNGLQDERLSDSTSTPDAPDMLDGVHDPNLASPIIMVFEVKELLGTFAVETLIWSKYNCTYSDEDLPTELLETVIELSDRRLRLGW